MGGYQGPPNAQNLMQTCICTFFWEGGHGSDSNINGMISYMSRTSDLEARYETALKKSHYFQGLPSTECGKQFVLNKKIIKAYDD